MHYTVNKIGKKNLYKIVFHNNNGIKYGTVNVYSETPSFDSIVVSAEEYAANRELVNTVADGLSYAYVERDKDGFRPIRNTMSCPEFIKFAVNNYFKATARLVTARG